MTILTGKPDPVRAASGSWQQHLKWAVRDWETLGRHLGLPPEFAHQGQEASQQFPLFVPLPFLSRMRPGDLSDPLLRQVLPLSDELASPERFSRDPLNEQAATLVPGLLQKYHGRALLITTGACAVHCRYCFRREFPYSSAPKSIDQWMPALQKIQADATINEVIFSGGDPLTIKDALLGELVDEIAKIPHVIRLRIHTRLPIMIPQRTTPSLLEALQPGRFQLVTILHSNHANEFDTEVDHSVRSWRDAGATLLNQTVLLRGINDDEETLVSLSERLLQIGVLPYYLHQLDPVIGTAHFEVTQQRGQTLIEGMRKRLPGYGVPRYVKELAGEQSKTIWE